MKRKEEIKEYQKEYRENNKEYFENYNKEVVIFRLKRPHSQEQADEYEKLQIRLNKLYEETNQIPLVITDEIEIIRYGN
jgi:hypothetical protein